jgi:hypothetical protein
VGALGLAGALAAWPQMFHEPARVAAGAFSIMAWGTAPSEPARLAEMREAGLNLAGFCRPEDAAAVRDAGLSCFVRDKRVNGYDWRALPADAELRAQIAVAAKEIMGNPAVLGFYLIDEPSGEIMPALARVARLVKELAPGRIPYINLFPNVVSKDRIATPDYETYVRRLATEVGQPFLSYDNYALQDGAMRDQFYDNLEIVRKVSLETGRPFWNCILANAHFNYMEPSDATLHLQVYGTLAYGGRGIQYFTYSTPHIGNYRLAPLDPFGHRTATWDALRRVNLEIHALAPRLLELRSTGVFHSGAMEQSRLVRRISTSRREQDRYLIGEFEDRQGRPHFMLVNKDLARSFRFTVELKQEGRKLIRICNYSGKEEGFGREMDWLAPGAGILFRVE